MDDRSCPVSTPHPRSPGQRRDRVRAARRARVRGVFAAAIPTRAAKPTTTLSRATNVDVPLGEVAADSAGPPLNVSTRTGAGRSSTC